MNNKFFKILLIFVTCFSFTQVSGMEEIEENEPGFVKKYLLSNPGLAAAAFAAGYGLNKFGHGELSKFAYMYSLFFGIETTRKITDHFFRSLISKSKFLAFALSIRESLVPIFNYFFANKIFSRNENLDFLYSRATTEFICCMITVNFAIINSTIQEKTKKQDISFGQTFMHALYATGFGLGNLIKTETEVDKILNFYFIDYTFKTITGLLYLIYKVFTDPQTKIFKNFENKKLQKIEVHNKKIESLTKVIKYKRIYSLILNSYKYTTPALTYLAAKKILNVQPAGAN